MTMIVKPLSETHPELAKQAHGWDPSSVTPYSNKKADWICSFGHIWNCTISGRSRYKTGCPVCSGQRPEIGVSDLATKFPDIASEADGWDPRNFLPKTNKSMPWVCSLGHRWNMRIIARTTALASCPFCQDKKVLPGFNDLATKFPKLAEEAIGWNPTTVTCKDQEMRRWKCGDESHNWQARVYDRVFREVSCTKCHDWNSSPVKQGVNDLLTKFPLIAREALDWDPKLVAYGSRKKFRWLCSAGHDYTTSPLSRTSSNSGCPFCSGKKLLPGFNDFKTRCPEFAKEASGWNPSEVLYGTNRKYLWRCELGHEWRVSPRQRYSKETGCPICANKQLLTGFNDLATRFPLLAAEAYEWDPRTVLGSGKAKLNWRCSKGHQWRATINNRTGSNGTNCPSCSNAGFDPNEAGYLYFLEHEIWEMFQIGITNLPKRRIREHQNSGWKVIEIRGPMDGHLTQDWETAILRMLKANGADLSNSQIAGKFDGYSEAWSKAKFDAESIFFLMEKTRDFEARNDKS